jgi:DNA-binding response OmpR family regulator
MMLREEGYEVVLASNSGQLYQMLGQAHPDLLILDLNADDPEVADVITLLAGPAFVETGVPLLALVPRDNSSTEIQQEFEFDVGEYYKKPILHYDLVQKVHHLLSG